MTDEANRKREESRRVFSQAAFTYDQIGPGIFSHFGQRLVDRAELGAGANVLDVAAGKGALLFPAAAKVGPNGHVIGIDFSPEMVRETGNDIESRNLRHAEIRQMDAEQMDFADASFDWVLCGFALWMFTQPSRVLQEFHRVLRRGGRVAISTWATNNRTWFTEVLRPYLAALASKAAVSNDDPKFDTPSQLEPALRAAGFSDVEIRSEEKDFVYVGEEHFWQSLWSTGIRRQLEKMTPAVLERAKSDVMRKLQATKNADGFHKINFALFAYGRKPV